MISTKIELVPFGENKNKFKVFAILEIDETHLIFSYYIEGDFNEIDLKRHDCNERKWDLWVETCFEAFLKYPQNKWYIEFNFSPESSWNCFYLSGYRRKCMEFLSIENVDIEKKLKKQSFMLSAKIDLNDIDELKHDDLIQGKIKVGLSAVVKMNNGDLAHFAIRHRNNRSDFHDELNFTDCLFKSTSS